MTDVKILTAIPDVAESRQERFLASLTKRVERHRKKVLTNWHPEQGRVRTRILLEGDRMVPGIMYVTDTLSDPMAVEWTCYDNAGGVIGWQRGTKDEFCDAVIDDGRFYLTQIKQRLKEKRRRNIGKVGKG